MYQNNKINRAKIPDVKVKNVYGASEMNGVNFITNDDLLTKIESIGVAMPGVTFRIADLEDSSKLITEPDIQGELQVKEHYPYALYFNDPKKTAEGLTSDGFYITGKLPYFSWYLKIESKNSTLSIVYSLSCAQ